MAKILFATDLHGSEAFFLKVLSVAKSHSPDVVIISGDLTGKAIVPIVEVGNDRYVANFLGRDYRFTKSELSGLQEDIRKAGYYYVICSRAEYEDFRGQPERMEKLFDDLMESTVQKWVDRIEEVLPANMRVIMNPGNDDSLAVDKVLTQSKRTETIAEKASELDDRHYLVSCAWVNPTPWDSPRECSEEELERKLRAEIKRVSDTSNLVCDFHPPPYNTPLDLAPKLGKNMQPKMVLGQPVFEHVGSKAVRKVFEEFQPKLGLHGHIHESAGFCKIGNTMCVNPGSEYVQGIMHGYLITLGHDELDCRPMIGG